MSYGIRDARFRRLQQGKMEFAFGAGRLLSVWAACGTAADRLQLAITATAIQERRLRRDGLTRGLVTLCIGGGQGIALAIEALH
jgi:predicted metal-binding membrane protein